MRERGMRTRLDVAWEQKTRVMGILVMVGAVTLYIKTIFFIVLFLGHRGAQGSLPWGWKIIRDVRYEWWTEPKLITYKESAPPDGTSSPNVIFFNTII